MAVVEYALVGRRREWQTLRAAWTRAVQSGAHMVCIGGEAGIGKTRLAEELFLAVQRQGHGTARARAYALEGRLAYAPVADWLRTPPLRAQLANLDRVWLREVARLLPELLIEHHDLPAPEPLTERWQQKRLFEALRHAFTTETRPLLLLLDDLQWCDAETLAFLQYLVETAPQALLLVVGTVRSDELDEQHSLHQLRRALLRAGRLSTVDLSPLSAEETAALAAEVGKYALDSGAATRLYQATAGNPLFVVETVRAGDQFTGLARHASLHAEVPADPQSVLGLPPKVYAVIEARLAQLSPAARTLSQVAATIGRAFTLPLIVEANRENEEVVVAGLDELWQRRIVREQGADSYDFSHDLIRETAYISISSARRRLLHRRVAEALEQAAPGEHPSSAQIAWHYVQAGLPEKAVTHYSQAAATAHQMYAFQDAIGYVNKALDLLATLPPTAERGEQVLDLLSTLGTAWSVVKTYAAFEAKHAFDRAFALSRQQTASPRLFIALWGLHEFHLARAEYERSLHTAEECLRIAQDLRDPALLIEAHHAMWGPLAFMNRYRAAVDHVDQALLWYNREQHHLLALQYAGHDPGHCALSIAAVCLCLSGFPSQARRRLQEAIELAAHFSIPSSLADAAFNQAMICQLLDDTPAALHWAEITMRQSTDHSYRLGQAMGTALAGWAMARQGEYAEGLTLLQRGIVQWQNEGMRHMQTYLFALWIEACCVAGALERGIAGAVEAHNYLIEYQEHFYAPEIYRLHGDLLQLQAQNSEAEAYYQQAIALARQQSARSLELRAAVSLARLWQGQGTPRKAYDLLAPVYAWFSEGFGTVDLQEAKALLDQL